MTKFNALTYIDWFLLFIFMRIVSYLHSNYFLFRALHRDKQQEFWWWSFLQQKKKLLPVSKLVFLLSWIFFGTRKTFWSMLRLFFLLKAFWEILFFLFILFNILFYYSLFGLLRSAVLVAVDWSVGCTYSVGSTWWTTVWSAVVTDCISTICMLYGHICIARTCVCVQICISLSRRCHFIKTSPNNILPATTVFFSI